MLLNTLVVACVLGQSSCRINAFGQMDCSSPAQATIMSPQMYDSWPTGGATTVINQSGGLFRRPSTTVVQQPAIERIVERSPFQLDGSYVVPGSTRWVLPVAASPPPAQPKAANVRGTVAERRPYATPGEDTFTAEEVEALLKRVQTLERDVRAQRQEWKATPTTPVQGAPPKEVPAQAEPQAPNVGEKATSSPATQSENAARPPVGQLGPGSSRGNVPLPSGDTARLPANPDGKVTGVKPGDTPSNVRTADGQRLPDYATSGMMWTPKQKEGYQGSPHQESHALIESLQVPEAPVPDLIDDSGKFRVTIMSTNPEDRKQAVEDFKKGNGPLSPFKNSYLVRSTSPDRWDVKTVGLSDGTLAEGKPAVIMQEPSGRVFYAAKAHAPEKSAEALRKANPNFDPNKAPGMGSGSGLPKLTSGQWWVLGGISIVLIMLIGGRNQTVA